MLALTLMTPNLRLAELAILDTLAATAGRICTAATCGSRILPLCTPRCCAATWSRASSWLRGENGLANALLGSVTLLLST